MSRPEYASLSGPRRLGDRLLEAGLITRSDLDRALERQEAAADPARPRLGRTLIELGVLAERDLLPMLSAHLAMPVLPFPIEEADERALRLLTADLARQFRVLPCRLANGALVVAAGGRVPLPILDQLELTVGVPVLTCLAPDVALDAALTRRYGDATIVAAQTNGVSSPNDSAAPSGAEMTADTSGPDAVTLARENARLRAELADLRAATESLLIGLLDQVRGFLDCHGAPARNGRPPTS